MTTLKVTVAQDDGSFETKTIDNIVEVEGAGFLGKIQGTNYTVALVRVLPYWITMTSSARFDFETTEKVDIGVGQFKIFDRKLVPGLGVVAKLAAEGTRRVFKPVGATQFSFEVPLKVRTFANLTELGKFSQAVESLKEVA